jgi:hypothetical protein
MASFETTFRRAEGGGYQNEGTSAQPVGWVRRIGSNVLDFVLGVLGIFAILRALVQHFGEESEKDDGRWFRFDNGTKHADADYAKSAASFRKVLGFMVALAILSGLIAIYLAVTQS